MQHSKPSFRVIFGSLALLLTACGSGGGGSSDAGGDASPPPKPASSQAQSSSQSADTSGQIKVNQLGFMPSAQKLAVIPASADTNEFHLIEAGTDQQVFSGTLGAAATWAPAKESVRLADFSEFTTEGEYQLRVAGLEDSHPFHIAQDVYQSLNAAAIKAFYFNRSGTDLLETHAGVYTRPAGHPDTEVQIHPSAASAARPAGTVVPSPKGWYDAGDFNKYIVNSGIATYTLLAAFEHFPQIYTNQNLNIPESGDAIPDLLDEIKWNLDWMLTMQDPDDGGVYHKLTTKSFAGTVMPHETDAQRYLVQKSTAAALDFAAVMATASRVYADYETEFPGLSASMIAAAEYAWQWAQANPSVIYEQPSDIHTGEYGDKQLADEFAWAAAELYITTGKDAYYTAMKPTQVYATVPGWSDVRGLAWVSLAHHLDELTAAADKTLITQRINDLANTLLTQTKASAYGVAMRSQDFVWGSNSGVLNQAMMLLQGYLLNGNNEYLKAAQSQLDYVLGRNATDFSFVTGYGAKTPQHIHHRASEADSIAAPIPGFVAGGPHAGQQDKDDCSVAYPSNLPAKSYLDHYCSYASNEIAINWNAPLVYVSGALRALTE